MPVMLDSSIDGGTASDPLLCSGICWVCTAGYIPSDAEVPERSGDKQGDTSRNGDPRQRTPLFEFPSHLRPHSI